jgi:hypothetical protein
MGSFSVRLSAIIQTVSEEVLYLFLSVQQWTNFLPPIPSNLRSFHLLPPVT